MYESLKNDSEKIVKQALNFERPDRLPVFDAFWPEFVKKWQLHYNLPESENINEHYWNDLVVAVADETLFPTKRCVVKREGDDVYTNDGWGRIVKSQANSYFSETVEQVFTDPGQLDHIQFDPPNLDSRYNGGFLREVERCRAKGQAVFVKIGGVYRRACQFRGETDFLMDLAGDEQFAVALAEKVGSHLLQIGLESLRRANAYDCGIWIYDDMCDINNPMFSPATFEKIFMPVYKRMIAAFKAAGARWVFFHSDGNLAPMLDLLIECGIDAINPVEYAAGLKVPELMEKYGHKLRYAGGICNTHILPAGNKKEIEAHVKSFVDAGRHGGLVIGIISVGPDISVENYEFYRQLVDTYF